MAKIPSPRVETFRTESVILQGQALKFGSDSEKVVAATSPTDKTIGIATKAAAVGDYLEVSTLGGGAKGLAQTTIAKGDFLTSHTDGSLRPAVSGERIIGVALDAAVVGDLFAMVVVAGTVAGASGAAESTDAIVVQWSDNTTASIPVNVKFSKIGSQVVCEVGLNLYTPEDPASSYATLVNIPEEFAPADFSQGHGAWTGIAHNGFTEIQMALLRINGGSAASLRLELYSGAGLVNLPTTQSLVYPTVLTWLGTP